MASHEASFDEHQPLHSPEIVVADIVVAVASWGGGAVKLVELGPGAGVLEPAVLVAMFVGCTVVNAAVLAVVLVATVAT